MVGIMQPYFFPYIGYFQLIDAVDTYVNLDHVSFMKRSYMIRNNIGGARISIPVSGASQNKRCVDVHVNFDSKWFSKFLKTLEFKYKKTNQYQKIIEDIVMPLNDDNDKTISEFNINSIKRICEYLDIKTKIIDSSIGMTQLKKGDGLIDITKKLNKVNYVNAIGGQKLYSKTYFKEQNINLNFIEMGDVQFKNKYASILDLLFEYDIDYIKSELKKYKLI